MKIRQFQPGDSSFLVQFFSESVRAVSLNDYATEHLEVWAKQFTDPERWLSERAGRVLRVAEIDGEPVGFATFEPDGHIDHLYVRPRFQQRGIASALLEDVEDRAAGFGLARVFTEASIVARPFFERAGFRLVETQTVTRKGVDFVNHRMEKSLVGHAGLATPISNDSGCQDCTIRVAAPLLAGRTFAPGRLVGAESEF